MLGAAGACCCAAAASPVVPCAAVPNSSGELGPSATLLGRTALCCTAASWYEHACWLLLASPMVPRRPISVLLLLVTAPSGLGSGRSPAGAGLAEGDTFVASGDDTPAGTAGDADGGGHVLPRRTVARTNVPFLSPLSAAGVTRGDARACAAASGDADGDELCRNENFFESVREPSLSPDLDRVCTVSLSLWLVSTHAHS